MIDVLLFTFWAISLLALLLLLFSSATKKELRKQRPIYPHIQTSHIYFPRWKKLKYWQSTKKNPKRR